MSRLGRQISRGFMRFGRQLSSQGNIIGRQLSNTGRDIQSVVPKIKQVSDGISKALSPIPILGQAVQLGNNVLGAGLGVVNKAGQTLQSGGTGIRNITSGKFEDAAKNFSSAVQSGTDALGEGALLFA